jgi:hypothetical protein
MAIKRIDGLVLLNSAAAFDDVDFMRDWSIDECGGDRRNGAPAQRTLRDVPQRSGTGFALQ